MKTLPSYCPECDKPMYGKERCASCGWVFLGEEVRARSPQDVSDQCVAEPMGRRCLKRKVSNDLCSWHEYAQTFFGKFEAPHAAFLEFLGWINPVLPGTDRRRYEDLPWTNDPTRAWVEVNGGLRPEETKNGVQ